jgi:hypothetical protein
MYSFAPLADIPADHKGFVCFCFLVGVILVFTLLNEPELFFGMFFVGTVFLGFVYCVSYVWTDQDTKTFKNEVVIGEFVGYESEGYKERSGKSYVDRHYTYVIYRVPEGNVMLPCVTGTPYPQRATLYKN